MLNYMFYIRFVNDTPLFLLISVNHTLLMSCIGAESKLQLTSNKGRCQSSPSHQCSKFSKRLKCFNNTDYNARKTHKAHVQ